MTVNNKRIHANYGCHLREWDYAIKTKNQKTKSTVQTLVEKS